MVFKTNYDAAMLELEANSESSEESSASSSEGQERGIGPRSRWGVARTTGILAVAGLAVAGTIAFATKGTSLTPAALSKVTILSDNDDPCKDFPHLNMQRIVRNNLGRKGPVLNLEEGMVFQGINIDPGHEHSGERVDLHINALSDFDPAWRNPNDLGFSGGGNHFMRVNLKAGQEVRLKLAAMRPGTNTPVTLRRATFTFFDLDAHASGENKEYVKADGSTGTITYTGTELVESGEGEDTKVFTASQPGNGQDNPTDPLHLTEQQLERAVTFTYEPFTEAIVTLGSTSGQFHGRKFDFVGRPSLQCATGVEPDRVVIVESTPEEVPTCCLVKVLFIDLVCVPAEDKQFYHFMC